MKQFQICKEALKYDDLSWRKRIVNGNRTTNVPGGINKHGLQCNSDKYVKESIEKKWIQWQKGVTFRSDTEFLVLKLYYKY